MSDPFIAEVRIWGLNFAPRSWAFCNGQLLPISQYTALFSLVGTIYGGDGRTTLGLPNLQGRMPMHPGRGPGLTQRALGEKIGSSTETLSVAEMPVHNHQVGVNNAIANQSSPTGNDLAGGHDVYSQTSGGTVTAPVMAAQGGGQAHNNQSPYLNLTFAICLQGVYPSRN